MRIRWLGFLFLVATGRPAEPRPVLNEVCYDPQGSDAGREYVELYNPGPEAVSLAGARIEFANGAEAVHWQVQWQAGDSASLAAGGFFLIADTGWQGPPQPDAEANLSLQNGPDAIRLVLADGWIDRLGYGDLSDPELYESRPAPGAIGGLALARRPDGRDTDDNAANFAAAAPTPGRPNFPRFDLFLVDLRCEPPSILNPDQEVVVTLRAGNRGLETLAESPVRLRLGDVEATGILPPVPAGADTICRIPVRPAISGTVPITVEVGLPPPLPAWQAAPGNLQVGPAWVCLNEVIAVPSGGGEWIELRNLDGTPRSLAALVLRDEDGAWRGLPDVVLAPGACVVLAQDPAEFRIWWEACVQDGAPLGCDGAYPADRVLSLAGTWPTLNDSPPRSRAFADRLYLAQVDGTVLDHVTLVAGEAPGRRSWERIATTWPGPLSAGWRPSTAPAGSTPTCGNSVADRGVPVFDLEAIPNPFSPRVGDGATHLRFTVGQDAVGWQLRLYDLWGKTVRDLGGDDLGPGSRDVPWDGRDDRGKGLPTGGYVAALRVVGAGGAVMSGGRRLVVLREVAR